MPFTTQPPQLKKADSIKVKASKAKGDYGTNAPFLVITCSDFRLHDEINQFLAARGLKDQYDKIVLPGASIGISNDKFPNWTQSFFEQLHILKSIHDTEHVIIIDHLDCGMFKHVVGEIYTASQEDERKAHEKQIREVVSLIHDRYPSLWVEGLVMDIEGRVSTVMAFNYLKGE